MRVFNDMRCLWKITFASLVLPALVSLTAAPAWAFRTPQANAPWPTPRQIEQRYADSQPQPYAMNYTDEAARNLGIENGKWEAFSTQSRDSMMPRFKGGIEDGRAMIGLQWRLGS